jgi:hypothetical protein
VKFARIIPTMLRRNRPKTVFGLLAFFALLAAAYWPWLGPEVMPPLAVAEEVQGKPTLLLHPPLYSDASPLNQRIPPDAEIDPDSPIMVSSLIAEAERQGFLIAVKEWTVPVYYAGPRTPRYSVRLTARWAPYDVMRGVPIPRYALPDPMGDGHMTIIDLASGCEYDLWRAGKKHGRWTAGWGNTVKIDGSGIFPKGLSARGSGFALLAGVIWPDELRAGEIPHALVFSYSRTAAGGPVPPATESDGESFGADAIPEGARIQLNPSLDLDALDLTPTERIVARALQEYGMFLADDGGGITLYAVHPRSVRGDPYAGLFDEDVVVNGGRLPDAFVMLDRIPVHEFRVLKLPPQVPDPEIKVVPTGCARFK